MTNNQLIQALKRAYQANGYLGTLDAGLATETQVLAAEASLQFRLPPLLRSLYLELGDGGFGPSYGVLPLFQSRDNGESLVGLYRLMRSEHPNDPLWSWPVGLLPIVDWGCNMRTCVSCIESPYEVTNFDPNGIEHGMSWSAAFSTAAPSLEAWLLNWMRRTGVRSDDD